MFVLLFKAIAKSGRWDFNTELTRPQQLEHLHENTELGLQKMRNVCQLLRS